MSLILMRPFPIVLGTPLSPSSIDVPIVQDMERLGGVVCQVSDVSKVDNGITPLVLDPDSD